MCKQRLRCVYEHHQRSKGCRVQSLWTKSYTCKSNLEKKKSNDSILETFFFSSFSEGAWNSRPLREEERAYTEEHRYQHDYRSGGDLYDPFEPSSSPPMESTSSTLDKLASTLLELVARKTN